MGGWVEWRVGSPPLEKEERGKDEVTEDVECMNVRCTRPVRARFVARALCLSVSLALHLVCVCVCVCV